MNNDIWLFLVFITREYITLPAVHLLSVSFFSFLCTDVQYAAFDIVTQPDQFLGSALNNLLFMLYE